MRNFKILACAAAMAGLFAGASSPAVAGIVVSSASPEWTLLPNSIGVGGAGTWGLPAALPGCGTENELTCEPTGIFLLNDSISSATGFYTIAGQAGEQSPSDVIIIDNGGSGGNGRIRFYSDPNTGFGDLTALTSLGVLCTEASGAGCSGAFTLTTASSTVVTVEAASDAESVFDPFGYGFDTSDQIRFSGNNVTVETPEPVSLALLGLGLAGLGFSRHKRAS